MNKLIKLIEQEFEELEKGIIFPNTNLSDVLNLDSMSILVLIICIEDEYGVVLQDDEIKQSRTFEDLNNLIIQKTIVN